MPQNSPCTSEEESDGPPSENSIAHRREVVPPEVPQWVNFDVDISLVRAVFATNWRAEGVTCIALLQAMLYRRFAKDFLCYQAFPTERMLQRLRFQWICAVNFEEFVVVLITVAALYMHYRHHPDEIRNRRLGLSRRSMVILNRQARTVSRTLDRPSHSHAVQQIPFSMDRGHGYDANFVSGTEGEFSSIADSQGCTEFYRFRMRADERNVPRSSDDMSFDSFMEDLHTTALRFFSFLQPETPVQSCTSQSLEEDIGELEFVILQDEEQEAILENMLHNILYNSQDNAGALNPGGRENVNVDDNPEHLEGHSSAKAFNKDPNASVAMNPERHEGQSAKHRDDQLSEFSSTLRERARYVGERNRSYSNFSTDSSAMITRSLIALQSPTPDEISQNEHQISTVSVTQNDTSTVQRHTQDSIGISPERSEARTSTEAFHQVVGSASNILVDNRSLGSPSRSNIPSPGMVQDLPSHRRASQPIGDIKQNVNQNSEERYGPPSLAALEERFNRLREEVRF